MADIGSLQQMAGFRYKCGLETAEWYRGYSEALANNEADITQMKVDIQVFEEFEPR